MAHACNPSLQETNTVSLVYTVSSKPATREYMVRMERAIGIQIVDKNTPAPRNSKENNFEDKTELTLSRNRHSEL